MDTKHHKIQNVPMNYIRCLITYCIRISTGGVTVVLPFGTCIPAHVCIKFNVEIDTEGIAEGLSLSLILP